MKISEWLPKYLIEIQGHGAEVISDDLIEVSTGKFKHNDLSMLFAFTLQRKLKKYKLFDRYRVIGDFEKVYFKGTKSATIIDERWFSLQIEIPPSLRIDRDNNLPIESLSFAEYLSETIDEICN